jgi:hypothetical protein
LDRIKKKVRGCLTFLNLDDFDFRKIEFDRGLSSKHIDEDFDGALFVVDAFDRSDPADEGAGSDFDVFTNLCVELLNLQKTSFFQDGVDFFLKQGDWFRSAPGTSEESRDAGSVPDDEPGIIGDDHFQKNVSGEHFDHFFFGGSIGLFFGFQFFGNHDLENQIFHLHGFNPAQEVFLDGVFKTGIGLDDVP